MPADAPRQVFRPAPPSYVIGWVLAAFFGLPGLALVLGGLGGGDWVGPEIVGVVLLLIAAFFIRGMATSVLIATPAELVYWDWMPGGRSSGPRSCLFAWVGAAAVADGRR